MIQFEAGLTAGHPGLDRGDERHAADPHRRERRRARLRRDASQGVAGEAAAIYDINHTANHDLAVVVPIAIVAIGLLLALVLRSRSPRCT